MADNEHHARLVVHDFNTMDKRDKDRLVSWLHKLAHDLRRTPQDEYAARFTARLMK